MNSYGSKRFRMVPIAMAGVAVTAMTCLFHRPALAENQSGWQVGLANVRITPEAPIRMAGYANRVKPSQRVLSDLYAKALAIEYAKGEPALLLTADLAGVDVSLAETICAAIAKRTGLKRPQILLSVSHTHTGPVVGLLEKFGYSASDEERQAVRQYTEKLEEQLVELAAVALADMKPARLSWGVGVAGFVMNRREFTDRGVQLGANPSGYADRSVPALRVDLPEGNMRALLFGCATHNTTLGGLRQISGDYAGFAQQYIEKQQPGVQAMFVTGCAGSANPYPHGTVELARRHGDTLGAEVCRVAAGRLQPVGGPLRVQFDYADLPLQPIPPRERLEQMASKGTTGPAFNARRMLEALQNNRPLPTHYRAPIAVWQFGGDLTLVGLSGEVVGEYVPLLQAALGHRRLWIAAYCNDFFGYLPTAMVLEEGGYETRGLIGEIGYFAPEAERALVAKVQELAEKAGRKGL